MVSVGSEADLLLQRWQGLESCLSDMAHLPGDRCIEKRGGLKGGCAEMGGFVLCCEGHLCGDLPSLLCSFSFLLQKLDEGEKKIGF